MHASRNRRKDPRSPDRVSRLLVVVAVVLAVGAAVLVVLALTR